MFAGRELHRHGILDIPEMNKRASKALEDMHCILDPSLTLADLGGGEQKIVEIAKALLYEMRVVILDEPTASLSAGEIEDLLKVVQSLKDRGIGVIYISHHLDEVFEIADRITVLRDGRWVSTNQASNISKSELINAMVGRDPSQFYEREAVDSGDTTLRVLDLSGPGVKNISFEARSGEILGFSGMVGSGRSELMNLLFGAVQAQSGSIEIHGETMAFNTPAQAIEAGLGYITEDRQHTGLFLEQSITRNTSVVSYGRSGSGWISEESEEQTAQKYIKSLQIKASDAEVSVRTLSGGNQQKVVLGKWLHSGGDILIFDEPTRGIDVGAKQEIHRLMVELLKGGATILMVSSDMPEVVSLSNRIIVMKNGEVTAELTGDDINEETILIHSIGGEIHE